MVGDKKTVENELRSSVMFPQDAGGVATDGGQTALLCTKSRLYVSFHPLSCGYTTSGGEKRQGEKAEASAQPDSQSVESDNHQGFLSHNCPLSSTRRRESNQIICETLTSLERGTIKCHRLLSMVMTTTRKMTASIRDLQLEQSA